jgi:hypothetical protein
MRTFIWFFLTIGLIGFFYYRSTLEAETTIPKKQFEPSYKEGAFQLDPSPLEGNLDADRLDTDNLEQDSLQLLEYD